MEGLDILCRRDCGIYFNGDGVGGRLSNTRRAARGNGLEGRAMIARIKPRMMVSENADSTCGRGMGRFPGRFLTRNAREKIPPALTQARRSLPVKGTAAATRAGPNNSEVPYFRA